METLILPGFAPINKDWALDIQKHLGDRFPVKTIFWDHWKTGFTDPFWVEKIANEILKEYQETSVNIIAKSIGTFVATKMLQRNTQFVHKLILCGVPLNDLNMEDRTAYQIYKQVNTKQVLIIQNEKDPHASYTQAFAFFQLINPNIRVISQPRDDHHYPYPSMMEEFLK